MIVPRTLRSLSLLLSLGTIVIYFIVLETINRSREMTTKGGKYDIVAYSLLKRIELESEQNFCSKLIVNESADSFKSGMWTKIDGTNLYAYSIYEDKRLEPYVYLRIIAMSKEYLNQTLYCQILTLDDQYHIVKASKMQIWSNNWNQNDTFAYYRPYLLSCRLPSAGRTLSLNTQPCQINQKFQIISKTSQSKVNFFTLCIKPLSFAKDNSELLLQWIVINKILGASKFDFYVEKLHPRTLLMLQLLSKLDNSIGIYRHSKINNSSQMRYNEIWQKRRYELVTYNDCLYRNVHLSRFVIPIDVDEIIVPRRGRTWREVVDGVADADKVASITVRNAYYLRQFTVSKEGSDIFFLKDVVRSELSDTGESGKSFVSTANTLTVFNHYTLEVLKPGVKRTAHLKPELAQMNHYKNQCDVSILPKCTKYLSSPIRIVDRVIFKYAKDFYREYKEIKKLVDLALNATFY